MQNNRLQQFFRSFKAALTQNSESNFRALWHPESFSRNLVGGSGLSGDAVFTQAVNGQWTLVPDMQTLEVLEGPMAYFLACDLKDISPANKSEAIDRVYVLLGQDQVTKNLWLLGAGESKKEVLQLWERLSENEHAPSDQAIDEEDLVDEDVLPLLSTEEAALEIINKLNRALEKGDEQAFADQWLFRGYQHNLAGKGGLPGHEFFTQLKESHSNIKALLEYATLFDNPEGILIPINLWLRQLDMAKANDERLLLLVNVQKELKVLGVGTNLTEMRHLYLSYKGDVMV
jgi:hypothetical protein